MLLPFSSELHCAQTAYSSRFYASENDPAQRVNKLILIPRAKKLLIAKKLREKADAIITLNEMIHKIKAGNERKEALHDQNETKEDKESLLVKTLKKVHLANQIQKLEKELITLGAINRVIHNFGQTKKLLVPADLLTEILEEIPSEQTFATGISLSAPVTTFMIKQPLFTLNSCCVAAKPPTRCNYSVTGNNNRQLIRSIYTSNCPMRIWIA